MSILDVPAMIPSNVRITGGKINDSPVVSEFVNFSSLNLRHWRAALANVRAGTANAKLAFIGDSTTAGWSSVTNPSVRSKSHPNQCANIFSGAGVASGQQSFWGNNRLNNGTSLSAVDSRAVMGSWIIDPFSNVIGGSLLRGVAGTAFSWTPTVPVDTFDIYYINGVFSADIDGGTPTTTAISGVNVKKITVTASLGTHSLNLTYGSGTVYVLGVDAYDSSKKQVACWNWGYYGSDTRNWVTSVNLYECVPAITFMAPDLSIIDLTINDIGNSVGVSTSQANLQTIINTCRLSGDVVLVVPVPGQLGGVRTQGQIDAYAAMIRSLAVSNNCPLISFNQRWVTYVDSSSLGLMSDALHPSSSGYADKAQAITNQLIRV